MLQKTIQRVTVNATKENGTLTLTAFDFSVTSPAFFALAHHGSDRQRVLDSTNGLLSAWFGDFARILAQSILEASKSARTVDIGCAAGWSLLYFRA
jgi:hypothetical protein